ncbi:Ig-like V-type domain-containing protein FAM187A isoform X2 [Lethenteron reissneri]|uniref:Ig-like V-type domain-containing protein FAM187A isoform X2 n=1 Tax=Lethenteron reissneri TaxID=7753 RepID=UPI002AB60B60|nr:Ig-like V-type domain-containing protein FAM187A isoform X2 [Lethenteron reissneri]
MHTHSHPTLLPLLLVLLLVLAPPTSVAPPPAAPPRCPATLSFVSAAFLSGSAMELPCRCKPEDALRGVTWFYYRELPGWFSSRPVVLSDRSGTRILDRDAMSADLTSRFSILLFNLVILDSRPSDSGHYICGSSDGDFYFAYEVVVQFTGSARLVLLDREEQPRPELTVKGVHNKVTVFTAWSGWTPCDRCGRPGEMINAGVCMVSGSVITSAKKGAPRYVSEVPGGPVGCGSLAAPRFALLAARSRPPEILVRGCRDTCASTGSAVQDVHAALRELMGLGPVGVAKLQNRVTLARHVELSCPGGSPQWSVWRAAVAGCRGFEFACSLSPWIFLQSAVGWDRDGQPLLRSVFSRTRGRELEATEFGRVTLDNNNHLHILNAKRRDAGRYSCWLAGRMVAELEVTVTPKNRTRRRLDPRDPELKAALAALWRLYAALCAVTAVVLALRVRAAVARTAWRGSLAPPARRGKRGALHGEEA